MSNQPSNKEAIKRASEIGEELYKSLVLDYPVSKLPEKVFNQTFLPYFTGQKSIEENPEILKIWISIAGNPGSSVDIIDNNSDDVLFRVPPLYNTDFVQPPTGGSIPYEGIIHEFQEKSASSPKLGNAFLKNVLDTTKKIIVTNNNHVEEYKEMWNKIFDYYHIGEVQEKKDTSGISDDEIIFD
jgi:hypothetical protein